MLKRLGSITIISSIASLLNFVTTFVIVHSLGLKILGEFTLVNSITGLCSVIYTALPPNYSTYKYQDEPNYRYILTSFFILVNIPFLAVLFVLYLSHSFLNLTFPVIVYNALTTVAFYYYDIVYQATNRLNRYFFQLLLQSVFKIIIIYVFSYYHLLSDNSSLIIAVSTAQLLCLLPYAKDFVRDIDFSGKHLGITVAYIYKSFGELRPYYFNSVIKRVKDNVIIVLFGGIITADALGLYSLFIKITTFVLSLGRSFEAFFANRDNMRKYRQSFNKHILLLGGILQLVFLLTGFVYMKIYTHNFYWIEISCLSFLVYPYSRFLVERMRFLSEYNNRELNISMLFYITFVFVAFLICKSLHATSTYIILTVFFVSELMNYTHLIYKSVASKKNNKDVI